MVKFYNNLILPWLLYFFYLGRSCCHETLPPCPRASSVGKMGGCWQSPPFAAPFKRCMCPAYISANNEPNEIPQALIMQLDHHTPSYSFHTQEEQVQKNSYSLWNWPSTDLLWHTLNFCQMKVILKVTSLSPATPYFSVIPKINENLLNQTQHLMHKVRE